MASVVLLVLVFLTASFYRTFAHMGVTMGGVRVYVTELALLVTVGLLVIGTLATGRLGLRMGWGAIPVLLFLFWGVVNLGRGAEWGLVSAREAATNYYAICYLLVPVLFLSAKSLRSLAVAILLGTGIAGIVVLHRMATGYASITSTGAMRFHPFLGVGASFALFWFLGAPASSLGRKLLNGAGAVVCLLGIVVITQHRSAAVALLGALVTWGLFLRRGRATDSVGSIRTIVVILVVAIALVAVNGEVASATVARLQAVVGAADERNAVWRLYVWGLLVEGFTRSPIIGNGFGANLPYFVFDGSAYGADPGTQIGAHNSYLFVLYKEGLIGAITLASFIFVILRQFKSRLNLVPAGPSDRWMACAAMGGFIFVGLYACFNVVLEGPYMGMFFWIYPALAEGILKSCPVEAEQAS